jgi:hypothetical protein
MYLKGIDLFKGRFGSSLLTLRCLCEALYIYTQHALTPMQIFTV